jgi:hypothetical protein
LKFQQEASVLEEVPIAKAAAGCPYCHRIRFRRTVISNCYRIVPAGRLEIEAVVPTSVFEAFFRVV